MDCVIYTGRSATTPAGDPAEVLRAVQRLESGSFAWLSLVNPTPSEVESVGSALGIHSLAVEDILDVHQRAKVERYDDRTLLVIKVVRPGWTRHHDDHPLARGDLSVVLASTFVLTVHRRRPGRAGARAAAP